MQKIFLLKFPYWKVETTVSTEHYNCNKMEILGNCTIQFSPSKKAKERLMKKKVKPVTLFFMSFKQYPIRSLTYYNVFSQNQIHAIQIKTTEGILRNFRRRALCETVPKVKYNCTLQEWAAKINAYTS